MNSSFENVKIEADISVIDAMDASGVDGDGARDRHRAGLHDGGTGLRRGRGGDEG